MNYHEFYNPVKIISGDNALEVLPRELKRIGGNKPLIITDKGIEKFGLLKIVLQCFKNYDNKPVAIFSETPPDSSIDTVNSIVNIYKSNNCDSILGIGGGSVIDTAKGVNMVVSEDVDDILKLVGNDVLTKKQKPIAIVPTTSGTGSEATLVSVISNPKTKEKLLFSSYNIVPDIACLDSRMTMTLPPKLTAMTAIDALTHAIEAFTCLQKNPISDAYAKEAIRLISTNIINAVKNGKDSKARLNLAHGSTLAGVAFSNSMVGAVHSFGHATGAITHTPHGMTMNIFLPIIMDYNMDILNDLYSELLLYLTTPDYYCSILPENRAKESINFIKKLKNELYKLCQLPRNLSEAGITDSKIINQIAQKAINDGSILVNPKYISIEDSIGIMEKAK